MERKGRKSEQSGATRRKLLGVARSLFGTKGYADTSIEEIYEGAGMSRGALYHHFRDKQDLFRAIHLELESGLMRRIEEVAADESDPWRRFRRGALAFLDSCVDPVFSRIVIVDGPSVLGWDEWRAIESEHGLACSLADWRRDARPD